MPRFDATIPLVDHPRRAFVEQIMGLPFSVHVRGPQARGPRVARAVLELFSTLRADDARFSTWKPDSQVSRIRCGALQLDDADSRVREAAELCDLASTRTSGAFTAWLPDRTDGRTRFDPTGLVKGWAAEQAFDVLLQRLAGLEPHDALLSAGGDVVVACNRVDTPDWRIGVEDPRDRHRTLITVPLRRGAVATSGIAARGRHIIDPATGVAAEGLLSATVIGPSLTWADVYATAAFVRGRAAAAWLRTLPGHTAVLVDTSGQVSTVR